MLLDILAGYFLVGGIVVCGMAALSGAWSNWKTMATAVLAWPYFVYCLLRQTRS